MDEAFKNQVLKNLDKNIIEEFIHSMDNINFESQQNVDTWFQKYIQEKNIKFGQIAPAIRLALTGVKSGPSIPELLYLFDATDTKNRLMKLMSL